MRPSIDWLAGFALTFGWGGDIYLTVECIRYGEPLLWWALVLTVAATVSCTSFVMYFAARFRDHPLPSGRP